MNDKDLLDSIPADVEVIMTADMQRAFRVEDCDPACHCCGKQLIVGMKFKLAMVTTPDYWGHTRELNDEMLCDICTPEMLIAHEEELVTQHHKELQDSRRGYTRVHKG